MAHRASQIFEDSLFDGDENAIVDFKYSNNERLTWWFDHHQSAFLTPEDARHFQSHPSAKKMFDPSFKSCTNYIRTKAEEKSGASPRRISMTWCIGPTSSTARSMPIRETAVELGAPAMKLTLVIEGSKGSDMVQQDHPAICSTSRLPNR